MLRILFVTSLILLSGACAHVNQVAPATQNAATDAKDDSDDSVVPKGPKSIFESQTKEDVERLNHIDKSMYEVGGDAHPTEGE